MIQISDGILQSSNWKKALSGVIKNPEELLIKLDLPASLLENAQRAVQLFPLRVTQSYLNRIEKGNPQDPLLLQVLPLHAELLNTKGFSNDPVGDLTAKPLPGLIHKYQGRILLISTGCCAIHCRYCFRRHYPYSEDLSGNNEWQSSIDYIRENPSIREVILSGGDPLALSDNKLANLCSKLAKMQNLITLRIHSRLPIVLPERVTSELLESLSCFPLNKVIVVHANHPNEINAEVSDGLNRLRSAGITVLNQSVLLKNINDNAETLARLSELLFSSGTLPYYLHMLDKVQGSAHFEVPLPKAYSIWKTMSEILPGYLVPKLVKEQQGALYKLPVLNQ